MAFKITVERVDNGAKANGSFQSRDVTDRLPVEVIVSETLAAGTTVVILKKLLAVIQEGEIDTAITGIATGNTLAEAVDAVYGETA